MGRLPHDAQQDAAPRRYGLTLSVRLADSRQTGCSGEGRCSDTFAAAHELEAAS